MNRLVAVMLLILSASVSAHQASDSFLWLQTGDSPVIEGRWDVAIADLEALVGIDANSDGNLTWGEVSARQNDISQALFSSLTIATASGDCTVRTMPLQIDEHAGANYVSIGFEARCPDIASKPQVTYTLLFDLDPGHRGLMSVSGDGQRQSVIFSPDMSYFDMSESAARSRLSTLNAFIVEGVWHIWIGYDHVAFLILLLLPAVLRRRGRGWEPEDRLREILVDTAQIVTAFTVAHSVTLAATALGWVNPPMGLVEASIALSVILAGLHNIFPVRLGPRWLLALGFGLVHGFGFANVLGELGGGTALVTELIGFNVGVELGQLAIAAVVLPAIFLVRRVVFYRQVLMPVASLATALLATYWLMQRSSF